MIKVGFIGAGEVALLHKRAIDGLAGVQVVSLSKRNLTTARARARELGIPNVCSTYQELLADQQIDAIHCLVPNHMHYEVVKAAISARKHILAEKPLTVTVEEALELVELASRVDIVGGVNYRYRYLPLVQEVRRMHAQGELGELQLIHGCFLQDWLSSLTDENWRLDPEIGGQSGAFADIGLHWFDLLHYMLGTKVVRVSARLRSSRAERTECLEDSALVQFELQGGAIGSMICSQVATGRGSSHLGFEVNGTQSSVRWVRERPTDLWVGYRNQANRVIHLPQPRDQAWTAGERTLTANFYAAVESRKDGGADVPLELPTFVDGLDSMRILRAVLESNETGQWIDIDW